MAGQVVAEQVAAEQVAVVQAVAEQVALVQAAAVQAVRVGAVGRAVTKRTSQVAKTVDLTVLGREARAATARWVVGLAQVATEHVRRPTAVLYTARASAKHREDCDRDGSLSCPRIWTLAAAMA